MARSREKCACSQLIVVCWQLTGLDLGHHEDRMRAGLALRLLQVNVGLDEENVLAEGP